MARVTEAGQRGRLLLLLLLTVLLLLPVLTLAQAEVKPKSIADPDFTCGVPWGKNGEEPKGDGTRLKRQIIFPDEEDYPRYLAMITRSRETSTRDGLPVDKQDFLDEAFCGAAVISDRFIVTAAHCALHDGNPISSIRLGDIDLRSDNEKNSRPADYDIMEIIIHPDYSDNSSVRYNDLALLLTYDRIQFNEVVFPYCVPAHPPPAGAIVTVSGFGRFNASTKTSHVLEANFTILDTRECQNIYIDNGHEFSLKLKYPDLLVGSDMICAVDDVSDACDGDSGGPLIWKKNGREYLAGIVASGSQCPANFKSVLPGLYLSLAEHLDFLSTNVLGPVPPPEYF